MTKPDTIVAKALALYNEHGIEYVGMRELAAALDMRIGNLTYYFPTKDDIVMRIAADLTTANSHTIVAHDDITLGRYMSMLETAFRNQYRYRCLLLSAVHLLNNNAAMAQGYRKAEKLRNDTHRTILDTLRKRGHMQFDEVVREHLVTAIGFVGRFWPCEAAVSYKHISAPEQMRHYLGMIARILHPYTTLTARHELDGFLKF